MPVVFRGLFKERNGRQDRGRRRGQLQIRLFLKEDRGGRAFRARQGNTLQRHNRGGRRGRQEIRRQKDKTVRGISDRRTFQFPFTAFKAQMVGDSGIYTVVFFKIAVKGIRRLPYRRKEGKKGESGRRGSVRRQFQPFKAHSVNGQKRRGQNNKGSNTFRVRRR